MKITGRTFKKLANITAGIAVSKKCTDVVLLDVDRITSLCNYFVIATVQSAPQMKAVMEEIRGAMKKEGVKQIGGSSWHNYSSPNWQVLDYGGLIIHIMTETSRKFYNLERIWFKAKNISLQKKRAPAGKPVLKKRTLHKKGYAGRKRK